MDDSKEFIYVMINPSMPRVVKIGKTTRSAEDRAKELSGSSSIPTPFIVIYERTVENCALAEAFIHAKLDQYRVSENREFFSISPAVAINTVIQYKEKENISTGVSEEHVPQKISTII